MANYTAQPILGARASLGEGALWHAPTQTLYWVDILGQKVFAYDPATGENRSTEVGSDVGTVVVRKAGGLMVGLREGFAWVEPESGQVQLLAPIAHSAPDERLNDGKCDPAGRFWAGTIASRDGRGVGRLYRMDPDHSLHIMLEGIACSNGIVWTADARTMYYIDTPTRQVWGFEYDKDIGAIENKRIAIEVDPEHGHPDGMAIDAEDTLWIAMWGGGRVCRFDPRSGRLLDMVTVPSARQTTSCAFGGPNLDELFITSARDGLKDHELAEQPEAGSLFRARVGVRGVEAAEFAG
jgi:sugar lactone lactonase YvrE